MENAQTMATEAAVRIHLTMTGKVQGVWYRESARQAAERIGGLTGWIRNEPDGSVVGEVQGPLDRVDRFVEWCRRGPPAARVDSVHRERAGLRSDESRFVVQR